MARLRLGAALVVLALTWIVPTSSANVRRHVAAPPCVRSLTTSIPGRVTVSRGSSTSPRPRTCDSGDTHLSTRVWHSR